MGAASLPPPAGERDLNRETGSPGHATLRAWGGIALLLGGVLALVAVVGGVLVSPEQRRPSLDGPGAAADETFEANPSLHPIYVSALSEGLGRPLAVAASSRDDVYVADGECRCVRVFDRAGTLVSTLGPAVADEEIEYPVAVTLDEAGVLYVSDLTGGRILLFRDGTYLGPLKKGEIAGNLSAPAGVAFYQGFLYVNDLYRHQVLVFDEESGTLVRAIGAGKGTEVGDLSYANFSLPLPDGSLLVADSNNSRMQLFASRGSAATIWHGPVSVPRGVTRDDKGNIYVASTLNGRIEVFSATGVYLGGYRGLKDGPGEFGFPTGITAIGNTLYVVDRANSRVQIGIWP